MDVLTHAWMSCKEKKRDLRSGNQSHIVYQTSFDVRLSILRKIFHAIALKS